MPQPRGIVAIGTASPIQRENDWKTMPQISITVNGEARSAECAETTLLSHFLREHLGLTGTHIGCDTSQCGACVVHVDGHTVKSCTMLALQAEGADVTTIEGLADGDTLHPMQDAFRRHHGLQCGFCTPGMVMTAVAIVRDNPDIDETGVREALEGNICRCTGYQGIVEAILDVAKTMRA